MKNIILILLTSFSFISATQSHTLDTTPVDVQLSKYSNQIDCTSSYRYFTLGTGPVILIPSLGVGYRSRMMHHGFDVSLTASTVIFAHSIQGSLLYHYYPDCARQDPWYIGAGVATSLYFENMGNSYGGISPDIVIGKELYSHRNTKHFIEAHVQAPTWLGNSFKKNHIERLDFPLVYIKYGLAF